MVSRLYRTTSPLFLAVHAALQRLGLATLGTPTLAARVSVFYYRARRERVWFAHPRISRALLPPAWIRVLQNPAPATGHARVQSGPRPA